MHGEIWENANDEATGARPGYAKSSYNKHESHADVKSIESACGGTKKVVE